MKSWLKENWFKLGILVAIFAALILLISRNNSNQNSQSTIAGNTTIQSSSSAARIIGNNNPADVSSSTPKNIQAPFIMNLDMSASEIDTFLTGVVKITCGTADGTIQGSGSLWKMSNSYVVLTNRHILSSAPNSFPASSGYSDGSCIVMISDQQGKNSGMFKIYPDKAKSWNSDTDAAVLDLFPFYPVGPYSPVIEKQNYTISALGQCLSTMQMGAPVVVIGYPAFAQKRIYKVNGDTYDTYEFDAITITNGVISAYDTTAQSQYGFGSLPYQNYFVSNRIDHGNSGGIALSKNNGKLCVLGIPTWLNQGVSDTQGIVQNIDNIMYAGN